MPKTSSPLSLAKAVAVAAFLPTAVLAQTPPPAAPPPAPDYTLTANAGLFTEYIFRGISQTAGKPAVQGGFDWAHSSGFYLGTWASNISWLEDFNLYTRSSLEWDFYGGYKFPINDDWNIDVGTLYYLYPGKKLPGVVSANSWEIYAALNWKWLGAKASYSLDDYFGAQPTGQKTDGTWYFDFYANYPVGESGFTIIGHYGILNVSSRRQRQLEGLVQRLEDRRLLCRRRRPAEGLRVRRVLQRQQREEGVLHRRDRLQHREGRGRRLRQEDVLSVAHVIDRPTAFPRGRT
jgi:uncharacterized protein (TIGR02001 family)